MIMTDEAWFVIRNTPDVTGFIGSSGGGAKPFPVPKEQIEGVLNYHKVFKYCKKEYLINSIKETLFNGAKEEFLLDRHP